MSASIYMYMCGGVCVATDGWLCSRALCRTYGMTDIEFWRSELTDVERETNTGYEGHVHRGKGGRVDARGLQLLE